MNPPTVASVRKRIVMFHFAAGLNLMMGFYVLFAGGGVVTGGMRTLITVIFFAFAALNFHVARTLSRRLEEQIRQPQAQRAVNE